MGISGIDKKEDNMFSRFFTRALLSSLFFVQFTPYALSNTSLENVVDGIGKDTLSRYLYAYRESINKTDDLIDKEVAVRMDFVATKIAGVDEKLGEFWPGFKIEKLIIALTGKGMKDDYYAYNFRPDGECWKPMIVDAADPYYKHTKPEIYLEENVLENKEGRKAEASIFSSDIWYLAGARLSDAMINIVRDRFDDYKHTWKQSAVVSEAFGDMPSPPYTVFNKH